MDERMDEWECRSAGTHGEGPYSIERGPSEDGPLQKAATGISSYPLACAIEGIANGLDEFMDICPSVGTAPQRPKADPQMVTCFQCRGDGTCFATDDPCPVCGGLGSITDDPVAPAPQEAQADPKKGQGFGGYDASKARNRDLPVPDEAEGDGTGDEKLGSAPGPAGTPSRRHYTQREVAAAKRLGLADGKLTKLAGPIFWAGGDHYPNLVRQNAADYKLLAAAMEREWSKYANES